MRDNPYKDLPPLERRPDGSLYRMTPAQRKQAASLIRRECCCCEDGNCIVLDDGDTCTCPQTFRWSVLPLDGTLEAEIFRDRDLKRCADCGWSLSYGENRQNSKPYGHYHCSKYGQGTRQCSMHYIRYDVLYAYVLSRLQYWSGLVQNGEGELMKRLLNASDKEQAAARKRQAAELKRTEKRKAEVDKLFSRMYEDWVAGRITEYNFNMLSGKYQTEQAQLDEKIGQLQAAIAAESQTVADAESWIALMKQYVNPTELTAELLNTLIEKIVVHEAVKGEDGSREQEVEIFYRFIGKID